MFKALAKSLILIISCYCLANCSLSNIKADNITQNVEDRSLQTIEESKIVGSEESSWQSSFSKIGSNQYLEYLQVVDGATFVLAENGELFQTSDNGKNWKSTKLKIPEKSFISSLQFFDLSTGVFSAIRSPEDALDTDSFSSWIFVTTDGGATWKEQYKIKSAEIRKVVFDEEKKIWAIGRKIVREDQINNHPLIILGQAEGDWSQISSPKELKGSIENIFVDKDKKILINNYGQIFELDDKLSWSEISGIENIKPPQIGISTIGITDDKKLYLIGATGGKEGSWTSVFSKDEALNEWKQFELNNVYIQDAVFISSKEIIACGSLIESGDSKSNELRKGVILHSFDGGKNWLVSFKASKNTSFSKISNYQENKLIVIGNNGEILSLEKN